MVKKLNVGMAATFGKGTTRIHSKIVKTSGRIDLSTCYPVEPDGDIVEVFGTEKIVLGFSTRASIDILIQKLNDLKDLMEEANYG